MRATVNVLCITEERLQIHSLMEQRNANHTFATGSEVVLFDITSKKEVYKISISSSSKVIIES